MKNENKGITLIALVVTIIVLLILAGVTISLVIGQNGIIRKANDTKTVTKQAEAEEKVQLAISALIIDMRGDTSKIKPNDIAKEIKKDGINVTVDGNEYPSIITFPDQIEVIVQQDLTIGGKKEEEPIEKVESTSSLWIFDAATKTLQYYKGDLSEYTDKVFEIPNYIDGVEIENVGDGSNYIAAANLDGWKIKIPRGIKKIAGYAFNNNGNFENIEVEIGDTVQEIGMDAFYGCSFSNGIVIPNSVKTIGFGCYTSAVIKQGDIIIGDGVTTIEENAFFTLIGNQTRIILGNSVKNIMMSAFYDCDGITGDIVIPDSVEIIQDMAFLRNRIWRKTNTF